MYLKKMMDIITSENMKMPYEMKEMALEAVVQLWRIPSLVTELYINYDCDFYCSNLFEDLTKLLSKVTLTESFKSANDLCFLSPEEWKRVLHIPNERCPLFQNAFPVSGQLYTTHLLSLEALLTVIDSIEAHCQAKVLSGAAHQEQLEAEGRSSPKEAADAAAGTTPRSGRTRTSTARLIVFRGNCKKSVSPVCVEPQQSIPNGLPHVDLTPAGPQTAGPQGPDKMRPSRQDQGDGDAGQGLTFESPCLPRVGLSCDTAVFFCVVAAEKRGPPKPQRFSTPLPGSQELMEIRTKKKARGAGWAALGRVISGPSCYAVFPAADRWHGAVQPEAEEGHPVPAGERAPQHSHRQQPDRSVAQGKSPAGQEDDWRVHQ